MIEPFQTTFAVPMTCESCVKDVSDSLYKVEGIKKVEANLKDQLIFIEGTAPPSSIVTAIQSTGRDAILRGSGTSNSMLYLPLRGQNCEGGTETWWCDTRQAPPSAY
jgi:copper chaperone for superoxide dismutase